MAAKTDWAAGDTITHTDLNDLGAEVNAKNVAAVIVITGTEARPTGSDVVFWVDPRVDATRPDNAGDTDLWFSPNGAAGSGDTEAPSVPTGLAATDTQETQITMGWSASTDNVAVTGYQIRVDAGTPVSEAGLTSTFTGLTADTEYSFDVRARDAAGNWSAWSTAVPVSTDSTVTVPSPLSRFNFDEGTGTTATAVSGGYTMTGTDPVWGSGTIESEISGYMSTNTAAVFGEWTIAVDVVLSALPGSEKTILWHRDNAMFFNVLPDGKLKYYADPGSVQVTSTLSTSTGAHRVVVTQDATTFRAYVDGVEFITNTSHHDHSRDKQLTLLYGVTADIGVDTLRFWDSALDATQVAALGA